VSALIDESMAWSLVRKVPAGLVESHSLRVCHDPRPDVWLQVHDSGRWDTSGELTPAAHDLIELYLPLQLQADLVIAQVGQSLDGRIATDQGHSHYITGPDDIQRLHRLRAVVDAVIVGASTVASDNPLLTVRGVEGRNPARVVLDPENRLDAGRRVFVDRSARTLVVRRGPGAGTSVDRDVLRLPAAGAAGFDPRAVLDALRTEGYRRVLIEGGGITVSRFIQAGVVDRLHVTVAPLLIGSGRPALTLAPIDTLDQALRPACRYFRLGDDVLFDLDLRVKSTVDS
jgi:diaminohydroxyphosphoribosylaminopyrimidine deaminase / 5-amino-6-(5-phosphoribosylamino)uracil reductase